MTTTAPEAALVDALAAYLRTCLRALAGLGDSDTVTDWPEPTQDLQLSATRVVVAVLRAGASTQDERLGPPVPIRVTPGISPSGSIRYDFGVIEQPLTLGVWAMSRAMRDDVDDAVHGLLNQPYWTTCPPVVSTTVVGALAVGAQTVTPASMADIWPGTKLQVGGTSGEIVRVDSTTPTTFSATFAAAHLAGATLVEVAGRRRNVEKGLSLRCPLALNAPARYDFGQPRTLDDAAGGAGSQRQEWRSVTQGTGSIRRMRDVTGVLQKTMTISGRRAF